VGYSYNTADLWRRNFLVLIGWIIFFQVAQILALDYLQPASASSSFRLFAKPNKKTAELNDQLVKRKQEKLESLEKEKTALMDTKVERDPYV
jgi:ATP-binding cassette, subfamily G (WHITE), member 2, SNQ2